MPAYSYSRRPQISVTVSLIIINVVIFIAGMMSRQDAVYCIPFDGGPSTSIFEVWGAYSWLTAFTDGQVWRILTYQFLHGSLGHLVFNMWALYFFGSAVEHSMGPRRFLAFYLVCGVGGALFCSLLGSWQFFVPQLSPLETMLVADLAGHGDLTMQAWQIIPLVGASASIYGVLVAAVFLFPHAQLSLLFPPVTLSIRTFALIVIGIATATIFMKGPNAGGEAGHLGGILMGAIVMLILRVLDRKKYRRW